MALKDWKKLSGDAWSKNNNQNSLEIIEILEINYPENIFTVRIRLHPLNSSKVKTSFKDFRDEKNARIYTKKYMRSH